MASQSIDRLRAHIGALERPGGSVSPALPLGVAEIDGHLPWGGLARGAVHEILVRDLGAGVGFCTALLSRLAGPVLWIAEERGFAGWRGLGYPPGLAALGARDCRFLFARARRAAEVLWAMEEALRTPGLVAALAGVAQLDLIESRRLQLAAEPRAVLGLLLRPDSHAPAPSAATTRWRLTSAPSAESGRLGVGPGRLRCRWRAELLRCRGGKPGSWTLEWRDETGGLAVVPPLPDRSDRAPAARDGGRVVRIGNAAAS